MGWAGPADWARHKPKKQWVDIGPKRLAQHILFFLFWAEPNPNGSAQARMVAGPIQQPCKVIRFNNIFFLTVII
jgi:hypothetical protein